MLLHPSYFLCLTPRFSRTRQDSGSAETHHVPSLAGQFWCTYLRGSCARGAADENSRGAPGWGYCWSICPCWALQERQRTRRVLGTTLACPVPAVLYLSDYLCVTVCDCVQVDLHPSGKVMMTVQYFLEGGDTGKGNTAESFSTFHCYLLKVIFSCSCLIALVSLV